MFAFQHSPCISNAYYNTRTMAAWCLKHVLHCPEHVYDPALAGIFQADDSTSHMWYRRTFTVPSDWAGSQVLLHFGAVDWQTTVTVNGQHFPVHKGG